MSNANSTVVSIQPKEKQFLFYSSAGHDKSSLRTSMRSFKARVFEDAFFNELSAALRDYAAANPSFAGKSAKCTLILPDGTVLCDSMNIPAMNRKSLEKAFDIAIEGRFPNFKELSMKKFIVAQNKQYTTIAMTVTRQKMIQTLYTSFAGSNMFVNAVTYEGNAAVDGAFALNPKMKNQTFLLLDIKESSSRIVFVHKGITLGSYPLPFGYGILSAKRLVSENMLFDHDVAELAVLNAKEKAKAKQMTVSGADSSVTDAAAQGESDADQISTPPSDMGDEEESTSFGAAPTAAPQQQIKTLPRKTPRILPKWMLRPVPQTEEGFLYENFRVFEKWTLEFLAGNRRLTSIAMPDTVYVNMPGEFDCLFPLINEEQKENGIKFVSLGITKEKDIVSRNLELYGGLFASQFNAKNNF